MSEAGWRADLRAAVPGWVACRALVLVAWFADQVLVDRRLDGIDPTPTAQALFAWDGAYYRDIAELGYLRSAFDGLRFHPLFPMVGTNGLGMLVLANVTALLAAALLHRLVLTETGDADLARRSATLVGIASPAFVTVWAYAEAPFLVLAVGQLLLLRQRRWWWAGLVGVLATLTRPSGLLLALPAAVEGFVWLRARGERRSARAVVAPMAAVAGPAVGMALFLGWADRAVGDAMVPIDIQSDLRGGFVLPPLRLLEGVGEVFHDPFGDGLHLPFAVGTLALVWVCWKHLPRSWAALAAAAALVNLSADNLNSTERYAYGTVPLIVALAVVGGGRWWRPLVVLSGVGLVGMATLAWYGSYVP